MRLVNAVVPGARAGLWLAGLGNLAMTAGFAYLSQTES